jgi:hypothetical protein
MLIGARLNWLLGHGKSSQFSATAQFVQLFTTKRQKG